MTLLVVLIDADRSTHTIRRPQTGLFHHPTQSLSVRYISFKHTFNQYFMGPIDRSRFWWHHVIIYIRFFLVYYADSIISVPEILLSERQSVAMQHSSIFRYLSHISERTCIHTGLGPIRNTNFCIYWWSLSARMREASACFCCGCVLIDISRTLLACPVTGIQSYWLLSTSLCSLACKPLFVKRTLL